jgi:hypothetical protein
MGGFMKYAVAMGSGSVICITNFVRDGSGIQELVGGYTETRRGRGDFIRFL